MARPAPSAEAFALVRNLLTDRPRHIRELVAAAAGSSAASSAAGASAVAATSAAVAKGKGKGKARAARADAHESSVPAGHPFVSGTFLKRHILPVLESQHLVTKRAMLHPDAASERDKRQFLFSLAPASPTAAAHWDRLLAGAHPGAVGGQYLASLESAPGAEATLSAKEAKRRAERELAAVKVARAHLNTRRARARDGKEIRGREREVERVRMLEDVAAEARREAAQVA